MDILCQNWGSIFPGNFDIKFTHALVLQGKVFKKCAFLMVFLLWCYVDSGMWKNLEHSTIHCILQDKVRLMRFVLLEKFVWIAQLQCVFEMHRKSNMSSTRRNMVIHSTLDVYKPGV